MQSHRQNLEQIVDRQQIKYQDLHATLPSEINTQLAEVTLALSSAEDQVLNKNVNNTCCCLTLSNAYLMR